MRLIHSAVLIAICVGFGIVPSIATAQFAKTGKMLDMGTLGGSFSFASGVNDSGVIVGHSYTSGDAAVHAFVFSNGKMTDIGINTISSVANAINDHGEIAGTAEFPSDPYTPHAFIYLNGVFQDIHEAAPVVAGLTIVGTFANGINIHGNVVGDIEYQVNSNNYVFRNAFLYSGGQMINLGTLGGNNSTAYGINDSGYVVGNSDTTENNIVAFLYFNKSMRGLALPSPSNNSGANAINKYNHAAGYIDLSYAGGDPVAALWPDPSHVKHLNGYEAFGLNNHGEIAGQGFYSQARQHQFAFLSSNGKFTNLGSLGGSTSSATAINNNGRIVGWSQLADGSTHAFLYNTK